MNKRLFRLLGLWLGLAVALPAGANCGFDHGACDKLCELKHLGDDAAAVGCQSRCVAERTACEAEQGVKAAGAAAEAAAQRVKSFFEGLSDK